MTGPDSSRPDLLTLTEVAAARIVLQQPRRRFLEPFIGRDRSVGEAARETGLSVEQMAYRVQAMVRSKLLFATTRRARAGRPITIYRAPAEIRAPLAVLSEGDVRDFFRSVDEPMRETFFAALMRQSTRAGLGDWVVRLYREDGHIRLDMAPKEGAWDPSVLLEDTVPAVMFNWVPLKLDRHTAKLLQRELFAVIGKHIGNVARAGERASHQLGIFLTALD
jgi:hypothetical protein